MPFSREIIKKFAKESDVELPKEFVDSLISEHISARDAYAEDQVNKAIENHKAEEKPVDIKESDEYKAMKKKFDDEKTAHDKLKADVANRETIAKKESAVAAVLKEEGFSEKGRAKFLKYEKEFIERAELDENGKIKDIDKLKSYASSEWSEYKAETRIEGVSLDTPSKNVGGSGGKKESEAAKIAAEIHNNLYGETKKE